MNRENELAVALSPRSRRHQFARRTRALRRLSGLLLIAQLGAAVSCGTDTTQPGHRTPPAPEGTLQIGQTLTGTVSPADTARFILATQPATPFVVVLEVDSGAATLELHRDLNKPPIQSVRAQANARHTPAFTSTLPVNGGEAYHVVIEGLAVYHLVAYSGGDYPEHVPVVLMSGDTVSGESIDEFTPHDKDEFLIVGKPGDEYDVFLQALTPAANQVIQLQVPDGVGSDLTAEGNGLDTSLTEHGTGRFTLPASGMVHPTVSGKADSLANTSVGAYRLIAYQVHDAPEHSPAALNMGDSILTEAIDNPGDVDEYTLTVPNQVFTNLLIACTSSVFDMRANIYASNGQAVVTSYYCGPPSGLQGASGRVLLPAGTYTLKVDADVEHGSGYTGPYQLYVYALNDAPEHHAVDVYVGDTITDESLSPMGDQDQFLLHGRRGDDIDIHFEGLDPRWPQVIRLLYSTTLASEPAAAIAYPPGPADHAGETGHVVIRDSVPRGFLVQPENQGGVTSESGPYRVIIERLSRVPEHHAANIALGDTVADEVFDGANDVDQFIVTGAPNQEITGFLAADRETMGTYLGVIDTATETTLRFADAVGDTVPLGRLNLPASGVAAIRLYKEPYGNFTTGGSYQFSVMAVNRAPEHVSAAITIGDTVRGEDINPVGDVDEYTFSGTAGDTLRVLFAPALDSHPPLAVDLLDAATGQVLATFFTYDSSQELGTLGPPPFALPASGTYMVRVRGNTDVTGSGGYQFSVQRAP